MLLTTLPSTELSVSRLCFGCWGITGDAHWGERLEEESIGAMDAAMELGVNFFDTAPMYADGASESLLGRFLEDRNARSRVVVATKIRSGKMAPADVRGACEESLKRLRTDYIDLYQTHWTDPNVPIAETWGAMQELQAEGKIRSLGVCNAGKGDLDAVSATQTPATNQVPYSLVWRMIEHQVMPECMRRDIGVLVYSPLMHGMLANKYPSLADVPDGRARSRHFHKSRPNTRHGEEGCEAEASAVLDRIRAVGATLDRSMADVALAWVLQKEGVSSVIVGAKNAAQFQQNINAINTPLPDDAMRSLDEATDDLKAILGDNPDMWDGSENSRYH